MADTSSFSLSHHGTMFVYPLQVRLYDLLRSSGPDQPLTGNEDSIFGHQWVIRQLTKQGYKTQGIEQEIKRSLYAAILSRESFKPETIYRLTPWGLHLINNLFNEAHWQTQQFILKVARRGGDNYQLIVRDTSFLSPALRSSLGKKSFKVRPVYELRRSRAQETDILCTVDELLAGLNINSIAAWRDEELNDPARVLSLISSFGKTYRSINDQYVHYALPYHYAWDVSDAFDSLCRAILAVGQRPVEWRGKSFIKDDIFAEMDKYAAQKISAHQKQQWFRYLLNTGFLRSLTSTGQYTLTGQGATWLETYFHVVDENFSHLDLTLRWVGDRIFWVRVANSTYLPSPVRSILKSIGAQETAEWFFIDQIQQEQIPHLVSKIASCLTIWKRVVNTSQVFK